MARACHRLAGRLWRWSHPGAPDVSFAEAVPLRRDRRALRRGFRAVARGVRAEKKQRVTTRLGRLSARHVPVVAVRCVPGEGRVVEFADGTRLTVEVREGDIVWRRLVEERTSGGGPYIGRVEPLFGRCWFRLHFYVLGAERCAVMVRIDGMGPTLEPPTRRHRPGKGEPAGGSPSS